MTKYRKTPSNYSEWQADMRRADKPRGVDIEDATDGSQLSPEALALEAIDDPVVFFERLDNLRAGRSDLERLDVREMTVILLRGMGFTLREVAEVIRRSKDTVSTIERKALNKMLDE